MNRLEKNLLEKLDRLLPVIVVVVVSALGFLVRASLRNFLGIDAISFLLPWYDLIAQHGLYEQIGDYNLVYQLLIWIMTKIPIAPLFAYKCLSCIFDYVCAAAAALLVMQVENRNRMWNGIFTYSAIVLSPLVFLNSAAWAQCDAIFVSFAILGLYLLEKENYNWAIISLGMSFAIKLQAVFILPVFLLVYYVRRKFSITRFLLIPAVILATASPLMLWGRNPLEAFGVYGIQTDRYNLMAAHYPSFWAIFCDTWSTEQYAYLKLSAIILTVGVLALLMLLWIRKQYDTTGRNLVIMAFLLAYSCVLFLPAMHERYGYMYEILAIILAVLIPKTLPLCIALLLVGLNSYGVFLFGTTTNFMILAFVNMAVYMAYMMILHRELKGSSQTLTEVMQ